MVPGVLSRDHVWGEDPGHQRNHKQEPVMRKALVLAVLFVGPFVAAAVAQSDNTAPASQQDQTTIKSDVNLVSVYFMVRDRQKSLVSDLPQARFRVFEDGKEQP